MRIYKLETPGPVTIIASGIGSFQASCERCDDRIIYGVGGDLGGSVHQYFCEEHIPETDGLARIKDGESVIVSRS